MQLQHCSVWGGQSPTAMPVMALKCMGPLMQTASPLLLPRLQVAGAGAHAGRARHPGLRWGPMLQGRSYGAMSRMQQKYSQTGGWAVLAPASVLRM